MKLIVGLGNPGIKYDATKHNVGFWVVDSLAQRWKIQVNRDKWKSLVGDTVIAGERVILCKPQTFMNLSGQAISEFLQFYTGLEPERDIVVVYDDMDYLTGQLKMRQQGSAGGHNGVKSIIANIGHQRFNRVRLGIGRPLPGRTVIDHVLTPFADDIKPLVLGAVDKATQAIDYAVRHSFVLAMNRFNE